MNILKPIIASILMLVLMWVSCGAMLLTFEWIVSQTHMYSLGLYLGGLIFIWTLNIIVIAWPTMYLFLKLHKLAGGKKWFIYLCSIPTVLIPAGAIYVTWSDCLSFPWEHYHHETTNRIFFTVACATYLYIPNLLLKGKF